MFLLVDFSTDTFEDFSLELSDQFDHQIIARLLQEEPTLALWGSKQTSSKAARAPARKKMMVCLKVTKIARVVENEFHFWHFLDSPKSVSLTVKANLVQESISWNLVIVRRFDFIRSESRIAVPGWQFVSCLNWSLWLLRNGEPACLMNANALPEVRVKHPVGKSPHANPNSLEHTVASQLVHLKFPSWMRNHFQGGLTIRLGSTSPGFLWVFGTRQRTKWGSQLCRVVWEGAIYKKK